MAQQQPFSYAHYEHMLRATVDAGYRISSFASYDPEYEKTVILRHDVDYTLDGLLTFAEIEVGLGCSATYLFRVHADEYNLFSCIVWTVLRQLEDMGHEIGLHFEAMNVGRAMKMDPSDVLKREKVVLEALLGHEVLTCSEHRELSGVIHVTPFFDEGNDPRSAGFRFYAMDKTYCQEMKYLSDSNAKWREGDLTLHLKKYDRFQVLVHPYWWFEEDLLLKGKYHHPRSTHI